MDEDEFVTGDDLPSGDEDTQTVEDGKHARLLDSISSLGKRKRVKLSERTLVKESISEFDFTRPEAERKVHLHELIGSLQSTTSHGELKKQLRAVHRRGQVATVPLSKVEEGKLQRSAAYESIKTDLAKWDPVVRDNRKAEQISFPLQQPNLRLQTTDQVKTRFKPKTPLEMEIAALLEKNVDTVGTKEAELTPAEEKMLEAMSLEEAKERRAELQKYRALLTYKQARAKREKKIKSRRYRRILKKERLKAEKQKMAELQRTDPEAYLEKIQHLERDRAKERMTLKHRSGSKYWQRQKIFGKYDEKSRETIQDMIHLNKELTQKVKVEMDDHDSESGVSLSGDEEDDPAEMDVTRGDNPWMTPVLRVSEYQRPVAVQSRIKKEEGESDADVSTGESEEDTDEEEEEEGDHLNMKIRQGRATKNSISKAKDSLSEEDLKTRSSKSREKSSPKERKRKLQKESVVVEEEKSLSVKKAKKKNTVSGENEDCLGGNPCAEMDSMFENLNKKFVEIAKQMESGDTKKTKKSKKKKKKVVKSNENKTAKLSNRPTKLGNSDQLTEEDQEEMIDLSLTRKKTWEDMEKNFETTGKRKDHAARLVKEASEVEKTSSEDVSVDPKKIFTLETKLSNSASVDIVTDGDGMICDDENQRLTIAQAFADDDVVDEFTKEKSAVIDRDTPKDIDLSLPGWGEWGGAGLKPTKKKRKRHILKAPDAAPRRDRNMANVIISEKLDDSIAKHQVSKLPFPYTSPKQYEQSIRAPIGKNWNPETAFRKLIKPKVLTKLGTIIKPINKSDVFDKEKATQNTDTVKFDDKGTEEKHKKRK